MSTRRYFTYCSVRKRERPGQEVGGSDARWRLPRLFGYAREVAIMARAGTTPRCACCLCYTRSVPIRTPEEAARSLTTTPFGRSWMPQVAMLLNKHERMGDVVVCRGNKPPSKAAEAGAAYPNPNPGSQQRQSHQLSPRRRWGISSHGTRFKQRRASVVIRRRCSPRGGI